MVYHSAVDVPRPQCETQSAGIGIVCHCQRECIVEICWWLALSLATVQCASVHRFDKADFVRNCSVAGIIWVMACWSVSFNLQGEGEGAARLVSTPAGCFARQHAVSQVGRHQLTSRLEILKLTPQCHHAVLGPLKHVGSTPWHPGGGGALVILVGVVFRIPYDVSDECKQSWRMIWNLSAFASGSAVPKRCSMDLAFATTPHRETVGDGADLVLLSHLHCGSPSGSQAAPEGQVCMRMGPVHGHICRSCRHGGR